MPERLEKGVTRKTPESPLCRNCGAAIPWTPVISDGAPFCCLGCAQGGPCYCSYDLPAGSEPRPARRVHKLTQQCEGVHR